jgi:hypothetical protein
MQRSLTVEEYISKIIDGLRGSSLLTERLKRQLTLIATPYLDLIKSFEQNEPTIEVKLYELREYFPVCPRLDLIEDILNVLGIPNIKISEFSTLLFNDRDYLLSEFLSLSRQSGTGRAKIEARPLPSTLSWLKYSILSEDFNIFSNYISKLDDEIISSKKESMIFIIDSWIKSNPYNHNYFLPSLLGFKLLYGEDVDQMTYDLLYCIWYTFAVYTNNPKISFEQIKDFVQADSSFLLLMTKENSGRLILRPTLEVTMSKLQDLLNFENDDYRKNLYQNTILAIKAYIEIIDEKRGNLLLHKQRPTYQGLREIFSKDPHIRSYLLMNLISRNLGFDPLFFEDLDERLFDKDWSTGMYAIHHKDKVRWWSIYLRDLTVINARYHKLYDSTHISTEDVNVLEEGIKILKELGINRFKEGINDWQITVKDINNVFKILGGGNQYRLIDGRSVLEWWIDGSTIASQIKLEKPFLERLRNFNDRIENLVESNLDYEVWLNNFYSSRASGPDGWIALGMLQMDNYLSLANMLRHISSYVHLEDVNFIRDTWGEWQ